MNHSLGYDTRSRRTLAGLALAAMLAVGGFAGAQEQPDAAQPSGEAALTDAQRAQLEEFRKTRAEMMQVQQELAQIQRAAVEARPELQQQNEQFRKVMMAEMERQGHTPEEDLAELRALQGKLQSKDTPEADRQALMTRLQSKVQDLQQAERAAMQNSEVQKAQSELAQAITGAMREDEPRTEELIKQLQEKQRKLVQIRNEAMSQQQ